LIQDEMNATRLADQALALLGDRGAREKMRLEMRLVAEKLSGPEDPMALAASIIEGYLPDAPGKASPWERKTLTPRSAVRA
jgi:hypothetical protein